MAPDARRTSIIEAAVPLIVAHGAEVTTRQIADAAGIAEGTVFRAFVDKNELIDAAVAHVMAPAGVVEALGRIDPSVPLALKLDQIVELLHHHVRSIVAFVGALGPRDHARHRAHHDRPLLGEAAQAVRTLLEPDREHIRVPLDDAIDYVRMLVLGNSIPFLKGSDIAPSTLSDFILRGIAGTGE